MRKIVKLADPCWERGRPARISFIAYSLMRPRRPRSQPGFTLIEMLTTVAALIILLGLMVSLARYVRNASAVDLTKKLLRQMDLLLAQYSAHHGGRVPGVTPLIDPNATSPPDENTLQKSSAENNRQIIAALRSEAGLSTTAFIGLPESIYNDATLRDSWGSPIVFMPALHPAIGMAPENKPFFFSAGPDRRFLTQEDNLYSYEEGPAARAERGFELQGPGFRQR